MLENQNLSMLELAKFPALRKRQGYNEYLWVLSGLALTACGGGGGGGLRITAPTTPINEGAPVASHPDIPIIHQQPAFAQARPARAAPVVSLERQGSHSFPALSYEIEDYRYEDGSTSDSLEFDVDVPDIIFNPDGSMTLPEFDVVIDGWVSTANIEGSEGRVMIDNYRIRFNELTTNDPSEIIEYLSDLSNGEAISLTTTWTLSLRFNGRTINLGPTEFHGVRQGDGTIEVIVSLSADNSGNLQFGTGGITTTRITYTFNEGDFFDIISNGEFEEGPDVLLLGARQNNGGYEVPAILANRAEDGFGNAEIVLDRRGGDSAQLRIDADGVTGDVYREGHQWYKDDVGIGSDRHTLTITEAGTYRADVAIDLNRDGHADIWVETEEMRVLSNFRTVETINSGGPTTDSRIPTIQEHSASTAASVVVLAEGANAIPDTFYYRAEPYTWDSGTFSNSVIFDARIPSITLHADGSATLPIINLMIDGWTLTSDIFNGRFEVEINDYEVQYDGITVDAHDTFDDSEASGRIISLRSIWTLSGNLDIYDDNGDLLGAINPGTFTIDGIPQSDGSIDITLDIYRAANGNVQFGSGQRLLSSETLTIDLNDPDDDDDGPEISFLGVRKGNGYEIPTIITNLAKDGFGNARIVVADGTTDSPEELLRIEADGVSGNVYADGHRWYKDGVVIQGNTMHTHQTDGAGRYHADVAVDINLDGHADIWVETLAIDIA